MAVGASKPTVVADADGFFCVKNKMLVSRTRAFLFYVTINMLLHKEASCHIEAFLASRCMKPKYIYDKIDIN